MSVKLDQLIQRACAILKHEEPVSGYYGCFSGGKDSIVIKKLCEIARVKIDWHYSVTTIDPPEVVQFIKQNHSDVIWERPEKNFFTRMVKKMPPGRRFRWCCQEYKEKTPADRVSVLGIRIEESPKRKNIYTSCVMENERGKRIFPIRLWTKENIWDFIQSLDLPYCSLYDEGFERIGCIGCPLASVKNRKKEFKRWPKYYELYRQAFQKFWNRKKRQEIDTGKIWEWGSRFHSSEEFFEAWINK